MACKNAHNAGEVDEMDERLWAVWLEGEASADFFSRYVSHTLQEVFLNRKLVNEVDNVSTLVPYQIADCYGHRIQSFDSRIQLGFL